MRNVAALLGIFTVVCCVPAADKNDVLTDAETNSDQINTNVISELLLNVPLSSLEMVYVGMELDAVTIKFEVQTQDGKEIKEVIFWHHWIDGSGPHRMNIRSEDGLTWIGTGATYRSTSSDTLTGSIEIIYSDGSSSDPEFDLYPSRLHDIGIEIVQRVPIE